MGQPEQKSLSLKLNQLVRVNRTVSVRLAKRIVLRWMAFCDALLRSPFPFVHKQTSFNGGDASVVHT